MQVLAEQRAPVGFPQMLKKWRKQRRVSQLDFSLEAGISQRHLSFLESGRSKPSREMVLTLSEALDLPLRERNQLLHAAGFAQAFKQRALDSEEMDMVQSALQMSLRHHEPYPALVADRNWNLVMANEAAYRLISFLGDKDEVWQKVDPSGQKNIYRMTFSKLGMRRFISNWDELAKHLVARLQREISIDPENLALAEIYEEITESYTPPAINSLSELLEPMTPVLAMQLTLGDVNLRTFSMISSFGTAQDVTAEELKVETFFPADEFTKEFFQSLAAM